MNKAKMRMLKIEAERQERHSLRSRTVRGSGFRVKYTSPRRVKRRAPLAQWGKRVERPKKNNPPALSPECVPVVTRMNSGYKSKIQQQMKANKEEKELQAQERSTARRKKNLRESQAKGRKVFRQARPKSAPPVHRRMVVINSGHNPQYRTVRKDEPRANNGGWMSLQNGYTPLAVRAFGVKTGAHRPTSARRRSQNDSRFVQNLRNSTRTYTRPSTSTGTRERMRLHIESQATAQTQSMREVDEEIKACKREVRAAVTAVMMRSSANNHSRLGKMSSRLRTHTHHSRRKRRIYEPTVIPTVPRVMVSSKPTHERTVYMK